MSNKVAKTIKTLWAVYSVLGLVPVTAALLLPGSTILKNTPTCYSVKQFGKECFMCGSTRSFIQFAQGNFSQAIALNKLAFIIFIIIIINTIVFITYLITTKLKKQKHETS